jgi:LacI family transcriptional regulator/LacI family repressor for deo operon, udp, cdd, tsx, nupC, and nupG
VSRALRDSPLIAPTSRLIIICPRDGLYANGIAQNLQTRRTNTIKPGGTSIADPFFADVAKGVEKHLRGRFACS